MADVRTASHRLLAVTAWVLLFSPLANAEFGEHAIEGAAPPFVLYLAPSYASSDETIEEVVVTAKRPTPRRTISRRLSQFVAKRTERVSIRVFPKQRADAFDHLPAQYQYERYFMRRLEPISGLQLIKMTPVRQ